MTQKSKFLKFQENTHTPSLKQGLERFFKVTPCNEKCNFFILQQRITLFRKLLIGIIPLCWDGTSLLVQLRNLLFYRRGMPGECLNGIHTRRMPGECLNDIHTRGMP